MAELMRLSIPRGWVVLDNKFFDTEPLHEEHSELISNWYEGFIDDVLWIQETLVTDNGEFEIPKINHFNIDISWRPDSNIKGEYSTTLSWCSTDELINLESLMSKNRFEIRDKIEFWMADIKEDYPKYKNLIPKLSSTPEPEKPFDFGGLPQRDLKKNLGCG